MANEEEIRVEVAHQFLQFIRNRKDEDAVQMFYDVFQVCDPRSYAAEFITGFMSKAEKEEVKNWCELVGQEWFTNKLYELADRKRKRK